MHNWQLVQELAAGRFAQLFINGSPGFRLLFVPLAWVSAPFWLYQLVNALVGVAAVGWFGAWLVRADEHAPPDGAARGRPVAWAPWEVAALVLLSGTGLLSFSGLDFTGGPLSLLASVGLLQAYHRRLRAAGPPAGRALQGAAVWLALGLCVSYKFLLLLPILLVLELWRADWPAWRGPTAPRVLLTLALPYLLLGALAAGLPRYRWLAVYYRQVVPKAPNLAGRQAAVHLDLSYYFRYLLAFESPLLLPGLALAAGLLLRHRPRQGQPISLLVLLTAWAGALLLGMSLLVKAPRGLFFAYLPLAALAVLGLRRVLPGAAARAVVLALAIALNLARAYAQLYSYPATNYPRVAAWLRARGATRIASTVGLGLAPYLAPNQRLRVIATEKELPDLRRQGYQYVLLDGYWRVAGVCQFDSLRRQPPLAAWPEPALAAPLLFLEHSEYTGLGYQATLAAQQQAVADSLPLRVYRIGK